jgi:hypothetical protein
MPIKRDFLSHDTTYGTRHESLIPTFEYRGDLVQQGNATVNGTATIRSLNRKRLRVRIFNNGGVTLYIGATGVVASDGYPILPNESQLFETSSAIVAFTTAPTDVRFFEELLGTDA